jgi:perosamine synthetase
MSDVACAIGMAQLEKLPRMLGMRDHVAAEYARAMRGVDAVVAVPGDRHDATFRSWSGYVVTLDESIDRDSVVRGMHERGIEAGVPALLADAVAACQVAAAHAAHAIALPLYPQLSPQQQHRVVEALADALDAG